jgi:ribosomal protein S18 acetylase RimI-like enzyme
MISAHELGLATPADAGAIARLSRDEIEHGLCWGWTAPRVLRAIRDPDTNVLVAREAGLVIGFALLRYAEPRAHLLLLGVAPAHRRRGIASALLAWLETTMRVAGIAGVQVEVRAINRVALAFYRRLGFEQIDATARYYQGVETALHLFKELGRDDG